MIAVEVRFHGPFRISQGVGEDGVDDTATRDRIPASSLKGVMRAAAMQRLSLNQAVVERVFGSIREPSLWGWTDLRMPNARITTRVRVPIDPATHTAAQGALVVAQEVWNNAPCGFAIEWLGPFGSDAGDDAMLLAACALAVKSLGSSRRRGLGWVSFTPIVEGVRVSPVDAAKVVAQNRGGEAS